MKVHRAPASVFAHPFNANVEFTRWVGHTQKKLLDAFPPAEQAFCRIVDKFKRRLPRWWLKPLFYTRQKPFRFGDDVVFFADFVFEGIRLVVEIDGNSHYGGKAKDVDKWRQELISKCKYHVVRTTNRKILLGDFRDVERWFVAGIGGVNKFLQRKIASDFAEMVNQYPHIYLPAVPQPFGRVRFSGEFRTSRDGCPESSLSSIPQMEDHLGSISKLE